MCVWWCALRKQRLLKHYHHHHHDQATITIIIMVLLFLTHFHFPHNTLFMVIMMGMMMMMTMIFSTCKNFSLENSHLNFFIKTVYFPYLYQTRVIITAQTFTTPHSLYPVINNFATLLDCLKLSSFSHPKTKKLLSLCEETQQHYRTSSFPLGFFNGIYEWVSA